MQGGETPAPVSSYGGGGAGGKLRRDKKPPATPYDRPPRGGGGWISRIVTPAKRLISGGATRLLPSLFSPLPSPLPHSPRDEESTEENEKAADHNGNSSANLFVPKSIGGAGPSEVKGNLPLHVSGTDGQEKMGDHPDGQLPEIEQLIKGKTFSREEIDRLMEVLRSKVGDAEQEKFNLSKSELEKAEVAEKPCEGKNALMDKEEGLDKLKWTATPLLRPAAREEVVASPVEIARAYMGSRSKEVGFVSSHLIPKGEKNLLIGDSSSKSFMPSPSPKAPICWPGAITQDLPSYSTPYSQKNRYGVESFPRTPYSRTTYTKSKSKVTPLRGDSERFLNISSTPFHSAKTPLYGKSMTKVAEGSYGSGGPIRRAPSRLATATPARGSTLFNRADRSSQIEEPKDFMVKKFFEPGTSSKPIIESVMNKPENSSVVASSVHPHSSKLARQILEQLDRPVTLKEKSEELKLAASWKNSSEAASFKPVQNNNFLHIDGVAPSKSSVLDATLNAQSNEENNILHQDISRGVIGAGKDVGPATVSGTNFWPSTSIQKLDSKTASPDQVMDNHQPKGNGQSFLFGNQSDSITNNLSGSQSQNVQRRPLLPSISVDKSSMKPPFASETTVGFTFPVTKSSTIFAEPPTPSIMPSSSASPPSGSQPLILTNNPPTSTIGNKLTIAPPVVASTSNDISTPKFKFGSGRTRMSFAIAGDDAASNPNDVSIPKYKFGSGQSRLNFGSIESDAVSC